MKNQKEESAAEFFGKIAFAVCWVFIISLITVEGKASIDNHRKERCVSSTLNRNETLSETGIIRDLWIGSDEVSSFKAVQAELDYGIYDLAKTNKEVNKIKSFLGCYFD